MKYRETWDLTTIPDEPLTSEYKRRIGSKGGRPRKNDPATEEKRARNREYVAKSIARKKQKPARER